MKQFVLHMFFQTAIFLSVAAGNAEPRPPKLVVYIVFDQFRADALTINKSRFLPEKTGKQLGGFNYLISLGAYFPFAEYEILSSMTCPGHAIISTGSWPVHMGISMNDWYSKSKKKMEYCASDAEFGLSPRKLTTTTISDEYKGADHKSKVFAVSLKDRAAIMLGGLKADAAFWFDEKKWAWTSSKYYPKSEPSWLAVFNKSIRPTRSDVALLAEAWGVQTTSELAVEILNKEKLGQSAGTDFLFISFSTHDLMGHKFGPNSEEIKKLTIAEDQVVSSFLNVLKTKFNIEKEVLIVMTGDHGIPPSIEYSKKNKISAEFIDELQMIEKLYTELNNFYKTSEKKEWFSVVNTMHYNVNWDLITKLRIDRIEFLKKVREIILALDIAEAVIVPELYSKDNLMSPRLKRQIENTFQTDQWGDVILMPKPFSMTLGRTVKVNHLTGYSYDKMVPLIFFGAPFKKQKFHSKAYIVDIHPTIAAILGVLPSPKVDGRILHEILK